MKKKTTGFVPWGTSDKVKGDDPNQTNKQKKQNGRRGGKRREFCPLVGKESRQVGEGVRFFCGKKGGKNEKGRFQKQVREVLHTDFLWFTHGKTTSKVKTTGTRTEGEHP